VVKGHPAPNLLFIMADQHRYDCMGHAGRFDIHTPHLDRLASEGASFARAYTPIPVCAPARQSLLCSRQADSFGAYWNHSFFPARTLAPSDDLWTLRLKAAGYQGALIGKWNSSATHGPQDFGYDTWLDDYQCGAEFSGGWFGCDSPVPVEESKEFHQAGQAVALMERFKADGRPFHLRVDFDSPHLPCRPSEPYASMYRDKELTPWDSFGDSLEGKPYIQRQQLANWGLEGMAWDDWQPCVRRYYGMVGQIDGAVGVMLSALDRLGLAEDTVVVYTSDHGDTCGGHGMIDKHYILYDDVIRVPLIIRAPGVAFDRGAFVSNCLDIGPTLEELCGLKPPGAERHGQSLISAPPRDCIVSSGNGQQFGFYSQRCVRTREHKYIWNLTDTDELYDLSIDPGELTNRVHDPAYQQLLHDLRHQLYHRLRALDDPLLRGHWVERQLTEGRKL
jgi:arylsulfatase A-like enzyme